MNQLANAIKFLGEAMRVRVEAKLSVAPAFGNAYLAIRHFDRIVGRV